MNTCEHWLSSRPGSGCGEPATHRHDGGEFVCSKHACGTCKPLEPAPESKVWAVKLNAEKWLSFTGWPTTLWHDRVLFADETAANEAVASWQKAGWTNACKVAVSRKVKS